MFTYSLICWLYAHHGEEIFKFYKYLTQLQSGFALKENYVTTAMTLFMITRVMQSILKVIIKCTKFKFIQSGYLGD